MRAEPRCYDHYDRAILPPLCHVCQRITVEREIVIRTVDALLKAGYALQTTANEDMIPQVDRSAIDPEIMEVDDEYLMVHTCEDGKPHVTIGWVRFVYGNDGWDVICDYTVNLETVLQPIIDYADTLQ